MTSTSGWRGPRDQQRLARELIHRPACLVPGHVQTGYADPPILRDADDTQVEQCVVQRAQRQRATPVLADLDPLSRQAATGQEIQRPDDILL